MLYTSPCVFGPYSSLQDRFGRVYVEEVQDGPYHQWFVARCDIAKDIVCSAGPTRLLRSSLPRCCKRQGNLTALPIHYTYGLQHCKTGTRSLLGKLLYLAFVIQPTIAVHAFRERLYSCNRQFLLCIQKLMDTSTLLLGCGENSQHHRKGAACGKQLYNC